MELIQIMLLSVIIFLSILTIVAVIAYMIYLDKDRKRWKNTALKYQNIDESRRNTYPDELKAQHLFIPQRFKVINSNLVRDKR